MSPLSSSCQHGSGVGVGAGVSVGGTGVLVGIGEGVQVGTGVSVGVGVSVILPWAIAFASSSSACCVASGGVRVSAETGVASSTPARSIAGSHATNRFAILVSIDTQTGLN